MGRDYALNWTGASERDFLGSFDGMKGMRPTKPSISASAGACEVTHDRALTPSLTAGQKNNPMMAN